MKNVILFLSVLTCLLCFSCDHNSQSLLLPYPDIAYKITYASILDKKIHIIDYNGENDVILDNLGFEPYYPKWSPDGERILFTCFHDHRDLFILNADGSDLKRLTNTPDIPELSYSWSPDGSEILFRKGEGHTWELFVLRIGVTEPEQLTRMSTKCIFPSWSPDGSQIVFSADEETDTIYIVNRNDKTVQKLYSAVIKENYLGCPKWSPDGTKISFFEGFIISKIKIMNADGSCVRTLVSGKGVFRDYDWSPDGDVIVFSEDYDIKLVDMNGKITQLTNDSDFDDSPVFSPDGMMIAYCSKDTPLWSSVSGYKDSYIKVIFRYQNFNRQPFIAGRSINMFDWYPVVH
ncbi:hypothetical protein ACFL67_04290 [candidate division KSB1 bacterium]